jgi:hypothetical protein
MRLYTNRDQYLAGMVEGALRVGLDGRGGFQLQGRPAWFHDFFAPGEFLRSTTAAAVGTVRSLTAGPGLWHSGLLLARGEEHHHRGPTRKRAVRGKITVSGMGRSRARADGCRSL